MNTLAAQTACGGGSSRSIDKIGQSESNHGNIQSDTCIRDSPTSCLEEDDGSDQGVSRPCSDASLGTVRSRQEMCRELEYFFMNPYLKYKKRGHKPWKLGVQLLKIIFVTVQLVVFGRSQFSLNSFYGGNREAFEHLFLKDWDAGYDSKAYPNRDELYAIYTQDAFFNHTDYVAHQFGSLKTIAIGMYDCDHSEEGEACALHVWQEYCKENEFRISDDGQRMINKCNGSNSNSLVIPFNTLHNISVKDYLQDNNQTIRLETLWQLDLKFVVITHLKDARNIARPDCIKFYITIKYDNKKHDGSISISFDVKPKFFKNCSIKYDSDDFKTRGAELTLTLVILIVMLCIISMILCVRSIIKAQQLKFKTMKFFKVHYNYNLSMGDRMEFLNLWYVIIVVSDICTIAGSIIKICIPVLGADDTYYDPCSVLLGTGCFLVWFGILKYLGLFNKYNILIVTLKNAMPNVLRFLICAGIIYFAYAFFGWIVFGPYHPKFKTFGTSVECLFSLINGDDMYVTFREMSDRKPIYWLSRLYLYTFISLFMYVVLNLAIAIIMDTYETMKEYQRKGDIEGRLHIFMAETRDEDIPEDISEGGSFHTQSSMMERRRQNVRDTLCCRRRNSYDSDESLIT